MSDNQKFKAKKVHGKIPVTPPLVSGDGKLGSSSIHREAGVKDPQVSAGGTKSIHRNAQDTKSTGNRAGSRLKKK
ncbi:MAG: hypothetical protein LUQ50_12985 [Methanospirillum sp.]|uniref:hypothetical protein n=1 Tax=Methanospirillum sp. TaxID=45200 RepID=UPI002370C9F7|nr:hypothetical protein [Methanospirillum sp.]MDD1729970.1 hypothetical protein [Methanospirillum sp.]